MSVKKEVALSEVINFLNMLIEVDKDAITALINNRVVCNQAMADHETVQVSVENNVYLVGFLGVLNGLFGVMSNGSGEIAAYFDAGIVTHFGLLSESQGA